MISIASCTSVKIEEATVAERGAAVLRADDAENADPFSITKGSTTSVAGKLRLCPATLTHKDRVTANVIGRSSIDGTTYFDRSSFPVRPKRSISYTLTTIYDDSNDYSNLRIEIENVFENAVNLGQNRAMPDQQEGELAEKIQRLIETIDIANILTDPLTRSIEEILRVTAEDLGSNEASVLVRDGDNGDLRFLSAVGKVAERLVGVLIPAGKGIAGFVLSSGQPIAVANADADASFYREVDKLTGYSTEMILATPLRHDGEVIGVLEYINRAGEPPYQPFSPGEMDRAARFADAIASLVRAYESAKLFRDMGQKIVGEGSEFDITEVRDWLSHYRGGAEHREMMDLAVIVREIAGRGEAERALCRSVLEALLTYTSDTINQTYLRY